MAKEIKASEVKQLLAEGKTRQEIAKHFDVSMAVMKEKVWSHPTLKNLKRKVVKDTDQFEFVDDVAEDTANTETTDNVDASTTQEDTAEATGEVSTSENATEGLTTEEQNNAASEQQWQ